MAGKACRIISDKNDYRDKFSEKIAQRKDIQAGKPVFFFASPSAKVPLACHSEEAQRPKNLLNTRKYEIFRCAQDDKIVFAKVLAWFN